MAGNTAINRAMIPHAAKSEHLGISSKTPSRISKTPLTITNSEWNGKYGGMIRIKNSGLAKCITPALIMKIAKMNFEMDFVSDTREFRKTAIGEWEIEVVEVRALIPNHQPTGMP